MKAWGFPGLFSALLAAGITLGVVSCAKETARQQPETGKSVSFRIDGETRAAVTELGDLRKIGVFGYSHTGNYATVAATATPDYFFNQAVIDRPANGTWTYDGVVKYWPMDGRNVTFFAYAPYLELENTFALYPAAKADAGVPTIDYTVPASIYNQIDLIWGQKTDMTYATSNAGKVEFRMDHALTRIGFQVKLGIGEAERPFIVEFTELSVINAVGSGTLDLGKGLADASLWTLDYPADDTGLKAYTVTPGRGLNPLILDACATAPGPGEIDPFDHNDLLEADEYLMLLPQPLQHPGGGGLTQQQVEVKFTVTNTLLGTTENRTETINLYRPATPAWNAGQGITYQLTLSVIDDIVIEFDIEGMLTPWDTVNGGDPVEGDVN